MAMNYGFKAQGDRDSDVCCLQVSISDETLNGSRMRE